jgi:hypothetical protein
VYAVNVSTNCVNWMYNCIHITLEPQLPVAISVTPSENPVVKDKVVIFTAIPVNGGSSPVYQWKVNGLNVGSNSAAYSYLPVNGDEVTCMLTSNAPCVSGNPATSDAVIMEVEGVPANITVTGIIVDGQVRCYSATQTLTVAGNGTIFTLHNGGSATMIAGQNIRYLPGVTVKPGAYMRGYITTDGLYCGQKSPSIPAVISEEDDTSVVSTVYSFSIYPNPTTGNFTLEQKSGKTFGKVQIEIYGMRGERLMTGELIGEKKHEFFVSDLPHGLYFVKVIADGYLETFKLVKTK